MAVHMAGARDIESWKQGLPEEFLSCRDYGHLWRPFRAHYVPDEHAYQRVMRCGRCRAEREQVLSASGSILSGTYHYEPGYEAPAGVGRMGTEARDSLRLESTLRLLASDEGPDKPKRKGKGA